MGHLVQLVDRNSDEDPGWHSSQSVPFQTLPGKHVAGAAERGGQRIPGGHRIGVALPGGQ